MNRNVPETQQSTAQQSGTTHIQKFSVSYEYPVFFTSDVFALDNAALIDAVRRREPSRQHRLMFILDGGVANARPSLVEEISTYVAHHSEALSLAGEPLILSGGEVVKNDPSLAWHIEEMVHTRGIDRQSFIVAVGGGALLDLAGYAAAVAHRGIRLIRVPTTVLAQGDSGIGVKNGVNAFGKKNFIGTFAPPFAVINDFSFLRTLSRRDVIAGIAEAVKVALIRDGAFFDWMEKRRDSLVTDDLVLQQLVRRSAEIHLAHITGSGDPFEFGSARPLDFGHWAAHRLESMTHNALRHGEAVAIGIALDTLYSREIGALDDIATRRILNLLQRVGFALSCEAIDKLGHDALLSGLAEFREHLGGILTLTMLAGIGQGFEVHEVDELKMRRAIDQLQSLGGATAG